MIILVTDVNRLTDKIYDANHKQIDFDYKKFVRIIHRIANKDPKSDELKRMIKRDNFKKIPNGIYYCSSINNTNEFVPCLLFNDYDILGLSKIRFSCFDTVPEDSFNYFFVTIPFSDWRGYLAHSKTLYAMGEDIEQATKNLKLKIFDTYRSKILNIEKRANKR